MKYPTDEEFNRWMILVAAVTTALILFVVIDWPAK